MKTTFFDGKWEEWKNAGKRRLKQEYANKQHKNTDVSFAKKRKPADAYGFQKNECKIFDDVFVHFDKRRKGGHFVRFWRNKTCQNRWSCYNRSVG